MSAPDSSILASNPVNRPRRLIIGSVLLLLIAASAGGWWWRREAMARARAREVDTTPVSPAAKAAAAKPPAALAAELRAARPADADLRELFRAMTNRQLIQLFRELGRTDFGLACELADLTRDPGMYRGRAVAGYAEADARAALAWALANPRGSHVVGRDNWYLTQWAAGAFENGKDLLYEFLAQTTDPRRKQDLIDGILHHPVITRNYRAVFDDARAVAAVTAHEKQSLLGYASSWAHSDPDGLLRYAATVTDPAAQRPLFIVAATLYAKINPAEAGAWAINVDPENKLGVVSALCHHWAYSVPEPLSLLAWLKETGRDYGVYADAARHKLATALGSKDFVRGLELANAIVDDTLRVEAFHHIALLQRRASGFAEHIRASRDPMLHATAATACAGSQPQLSVELIGLLPEGPLKRQTVERVTEIWKKEDASYERWLRRIRGK